MPATTQSVVDFITRYEDGQCNETEVVEGFQLLINCGIVWSLQGSYGRMAQALIDNGDCHRPQINNPSCIGGQCGLD